MRIYNSNHKMKKYIAISACLLGERVRYDGQSRKNDIAASLSEQFELIPFCPEMAVGMGVPRKPVQLVDTDTGVRVLGVERPDRDVTELLVDYANNFKLVAVSGIIFKARSPSCGLNSTPIYNSENKFIRNGSGAFAYTLKKNWPKISMIDEIDLEDNKKMELFLLRVDEL